MARGVRVRVIGSVCVVWRGNGGVHATATAALAARHWHWQWLRLRVYIRILSPQLPVVNLTLNVNHDDDPEIREASAGQAT